MTLSMDNAADGTANELAAPPGAITIYTKTVASLIAPGTPGLVFPFITLDNPPPCYWTIPPLDVTEQTDESNTASSPTTDDTLVEDSQDHSDSASDIDSEGEGHSASNYTGKARKLSKFQVYYDPPVSLTPLETLRRAKAQLQIDHSRVELPAVDTEFLTRSEFLERKPVVQSDRQLALEEYGNCFIDLFENDKGMETRLQMIEDIRETALSITTVLRRFVQDFDIPNEKANIPEAAAARLWRVKRTEMWGYPAYEMIGDWKRRDSFSWNEKKPWEPKTSKMFEVFAGPSDTGKLAPFPSSASNTRKLFLKQNEARHAHIHALNPKLAAAIKTAARSSAGHRLTSRTLPPNESVLSKVNPAVPITKPETEDNDSVLKLVKSLVSAIELTTSKKRALSEVIMPLFNRVPTPEDDQPDSNTLHLSTSTLVSDTTEGGVLPCSSSLSSDSESSLVLVSAVVSSLDAGASCSVPSTVVKVLSSRLNPSAAEFVPTSCKVIRPLNAAAPEFVPSVGKKLATLDPTVTEFVPSLGGKVASLHSNVSELVPTLSGMTCPEDAANPESVPALLELSSEVAVDGSGSTSPALSYDSEVTVLLSPEAMELYCGRSSCSFEDLYTNDEEAEDELTSLNDLGHRDGDADDYAVVLKYTEAELRSPGSLSPMRPSAPTPARAVRNDDFSMFSVSPVKNHGVFDLSMSPDSLPGNDIANDGSCPASPECGGSPTPHVERHNNLDANILLPLTSISVNARLREASDSTIPSMTDGDSAEDIDVGGCDHTDAMILAIEDKDFYEDVKETDSTDLTVELPHEVKVDNDGYGWIEELFIWADEKTPDPEASKPTKDTIVFEDYLPATDIPRILSPRTEVLPSSTNVVCKSMIEKSTPAIIIAAQDTNQPPTTDITTSNNAVSVHKHSDTDDVFTGGSNSKIAILAFPHALLKISTTISGDPQKTPTRRRNVSASRKKLQAVAPPTFRMPLTPIDANIATIDVAFPEPTKHKSKQNPTAPKKKWHSSAPVAVRMPTKLFAGDNGSSDFTFLEAAKIVDTVPSKVVQALTECPEQLSEASTNSVKGSKQASEPTAKSWTGTSPAGLPGTWIHDNGEVDRALIDAHATDPNLDYTLGSILYLVGLGFVGVGYAIGIF